MAIITKLDKKSIVDFYNGHCPFSITALEIEKNQSLLWATHYLYHGLSPIPLKMGEKRPVFQWSDKLMNPDGGIQLPQVLDLRLWWLDLPGHPYASRNQVGLVCGKYSRGLVVFDFDGHMHKTLFERFLGWYPVFRETLWIQTGGGSIHVYCFAEGPPEDLTMLKIRFSDEFPVEEHVKENAIELRATGVIVVAPPSLHPTGNPYKFANDNPIIAVPGHTFNEILERFNYQKKKDAARVSFRQDKFSEKLRRIRMGRAARNFHKKVELVLQIPIQEVAEELGWDLARSGLSWQGFCPTGHGSEGGKCFSVDSGTNLYHCFHCGIGGNVIQFVQLLTYRDFQGAVDWLWVEMLGGEKYDLL
jgi:hypothetical protein